MYVVQDGMHRIDRNDFVNAGINVSTIDPRTVKLYNNGVQLPIYFSGNKTALLTQMIMWTSSVPAITVELRKCMIT